MDKMPDEIWVNNKGLSMKIDIYEGFDTKYHHDDIVKAKDQRIKVLEAEVVSITAENVKLWKALRDKE